MLLLSYYHTVLYSINYQAFFIKVIYFSFLLAFYEQIAIFLFDLLYIKLKNDL